MKNVILAVLLVAAVICGFLLSFGSDRANSEEGRQKAAEREAIARCAEVRDDELQQLSTRRTMRAVCEQMDREFERKWGIPSREL